LSQASKTHFLAKKSLSFHGLRRIAFPRATAQTIRLIVEGFNLKEA
jgi:hypothetical protein